LTFVENQNDMKDKLIKIIAEYLETETIVAGVPGEKVVEFGGVLNQGHFTHGGFCQEVAAEIAEKLLPIVGEKDLPYDELFDHMANEHGLTLIQGELGDIIHIARGK
jgi:hypothetical protein